MNIMACVISSITMVYLGLVAMDGRVNISTLDLRESFIACVQEKDDEKAEKWAKMIITTQADIGTVALSELKWEYSISYYSPHKTAIYPDVHEKATTLADVPPLYTPVHWAAEHGLVDSLSVLLKWLDQRDLLLTTGKKASNKPSGYSIQMNPLYYAIRDEYVTCIRLLIGAGYSPCCATSVPEQVVSLYEQGFTYRPFSFQSQQTPFDYAIGLENTKAISLMLLLRDKYVSKKEATYLVNDFLRYACTSMASIKLAQIALQFGASAAQSTSQGEPLVDAVEDAEMKELLLKQLVQNPSRANRLKTEGALDDSILHDSLFRSLPEPSDNQHRF